MDEHSLRVLEYNRILVMLADQCATSAGGRAARSLYPSSDLEEIKRRIQETREARFLNERESGIPLGGVRDIEESIGKAVIGAQLTPHGLLDIGETLASAKRIQTMFHRQKEHCSLLSSLASRIPQLPIIENQLERSLEPNGRIKDDASAQLKRVRGELTTTHQRLMDRLNSMLASESVRTHLQEAVITMREDRYCLAVKAEHKTRFGGIVHDVSASGATVFIEPANCVPMGNELKELKVKEAQEVDRILTKLTALVAHNENQIRQITQICTQFDLANAKAQLAIVMEASEPILHQSRDLDLILARHPLLTGDVVPINVRIGGSYSTLLITGPNTGGKTVALKTTGLLCLMVHAGLQIPADRGSRIPCFRRIYADIGDEQDIQQSLSTYSAHMRNIIRILGDVDGDCLVLLDEIGAGTDPTEGAALAKALLDYLREREALVVATTHYGELKEYGYLTAGVENGSVEFDRETLKPTYRLIIGSPGSSNALEVAARLGLPEEIVNTARGNLSQQDRNTLALISKLESSQTELDQAKADTLRSRQQAERDWAEIEARLQEIRDIQRTVRSSAEEEARLIIRKASDQAERILADLKKMGKGARKGSLARSQMAELRREVLAELEMPEEDIFEEAAPGDLVIGERVKVIELGVDGDLLEFIPGGKEATVQIGALRTTVPVSSLRRLVQGGEPIKSRLPSSSSAGTFALRKATHIAPEIMIRAMRVDEALPLVDKYVDDALVAGLSSVRIVHGKGTGTLRRVVWEFLESHPAVESFKLAEDPEGGAGVTVVKFKG